jgi:hypothetical protein
VARKPVLVRISAAKGLRDAVEREARKRSEQRVSLALLREVAGTMGFDRAAA